jgi:hypothetical protein
MPRWNRAFTEHPASVGESYFEHLAHATGFAMRMIGGGVACFVHALLPFLFIKTGSNTIRCLHDRMVTHRCRTESAAAAAPSPAPLAAD